MSDLVTRLTEGHHPIEFSARPERTLEAFRKSVARDYVLVRFTGTRGGTELGVPLDRTRSDIPLAALDTGAGRVRIVGELRLDFVPVRCTAVLELPSLTGEGYLERLDS